MTFRKRINTKRMLLKRQQPSGRSQRIRRAVARRPNNGRTHFHTLLLLTDVGVRSFRRVRLNYSIVRSTCEVCPSSLFLKRFQIVKFTVCIRLITRKKLVVSLNQFSVNTPLRRSVIALVLLLCHLEFPPS